MFLNFVNSRINHALAFLILVGLLQASTDHHREHIPLVSPGHSSEVRYQSLDEGRASALPRASNPRPAARVGGSADASGSPLIEVTGGGRASWGDYFESTTHVYNTINESPHKKLFEQMNTRALAFLAANSGLILEFEVANDDFSHVTGPGLSSALFPGTLRAFRRLGREKLHPIALERYGDLLGYNAQVKLERDLLCGGLCLCCAKCKTESILDEARESYRLSLMAYLPESDHAIFLKGKLDDISEIKAEISSKYCQRIILTWTPVAILSAAAGAFAGVIFGGGASFTPATPAVPSPYPYPTFGPVPSFGAVPHQD